MSPLAVTPEDFLDEWVQLEWSTAAQWRSQSADLPSWHSILNALAYDSTEIEFVQPCREPGSADKIWVTGLWIDQKLNPNTQNERLYVVVSRRHHAFLSSRSIQPSPPVPWKRATTFDQLEIA